MNRIVFMKKLIFSFLFSFFFFPCISQQKELSLTEDLITINLDGTKESFVLFSSFFRNVQTIILETGKDCMIGDIDEFQVFDGCIYILDSHIAKSLMVFDMNGKFIRKIGSIGKGPGEYSRAKDFTIDTENRFIYLLDLGARIHKYQLDGTHVLSFTIQIPSSNMSYIQFCNSKLYSSVVPQGTTKEDYMLLEVDPNNGKVLSRFLSIKYNKGWVEGYYTEQSFFKSRMNNPPRYAQLFMEYIVTVGESITPYIELKSKNFFTESDLNLMQDEPDKMRQHIQRKSKIWDINSFIENNDFIIFRHKVGYSSYYPVVIYHKATKKVKLAEYFCNDLIFKQDKDRFFGRFEFSDLHGAYEILRPNYIERLKKSIRNNEVVPDIDKIDQLLKLNEKEESNPVIFFYEFK